MILNINEISKIVSDCAIKYPSITKIYLFGSYSNNSPKENSDIDLRICYIDHYDLIDTLQNISNDLRCSFNFYNKELDIVYGNIEDSEFKLENIEKELIIWEEKERFTEENYQILLKMK